MNKTPFPWWKLIVGYLLYIFFHQSYQLLGGNVLGSIFGEGIGGIYPHMKMLFHAYLVVALIDYILQRRKGRVTENFFYARMLILAAAPWMMITMYFVFESVGIALPHAIELTWALIMTGIGIYFCIRLEEPFEAIPLRGALKAMIIFAFVSTFITYVGFSFHVPDNFFSVIE